MLTAVSETFTGSEARMGRVAVPYKIIDLDGDLDIYARKSVSRKSREDRELSVNQQINDGIRWAKQNGYKPRFVWVDNGISGSKDVQRPGYDAGIRALDLGEITCLWCYKLDRFSRKGALAVLTIMDALEGKRIFFGADNLDTSNRNDRRMIMWRAEDAKEFSDQLSGRISDAWRHSKEEGIWLAKKVPYGLKKTKKRRLKGDDAPAIPGKLDGPTKGEVVQRVYQEADDGATGPTISNRLNEEGITAPGTAVRWTPIHVYRILQNPSYIGYQPASKWQERKDPCYRNDEGRRVRIGKPLVSEAQQMRAREKRMVRAKVFGPNNLTRGDRSTPKHLLSGLAFCAGCGRTMTKSGRSYQCSHKIRGGEPCPAPASMMATHAEGFAFQAFRNRLSACDPGDPLIQEVASRWLSSERPDKISAKKEAETRLVNAKAELQDLLDAKYKRKEFEGPSAEFFPKLKREAEKMVRAAQKAYDEIPEGNADIGFLLDAELIREAWEEATLEKRRMLLRLALDGVCIRKTHLAGRHTVTPDRLHYAWTGVPREINAKGMSLAA
ncbi:recombinase family protein [Streptomyces sp. TRM66268-LWL]|uniref:Recombinase family protein n=1 Tax=Streptomyces polyasparticus TaxID=2767826 RepID=A0ABR7SIF6_9ACTN|nr:recombinase family protein [Streptomyces polyasparticus]MBC9714490.1 recombinase family protein [Streptomyces polyasparticus]